MGTIETIVVIVGGIVGIIAAVVGVWLQLRKKPDVKPSVTADNKSTAIGGDVQSAAVAAGEKSAAAAGKGVAIGSGQQAPIVIVQPGAIVSVNTNVSLRTQALETSEVSAVRDAYRGGVNAKADGRHEEAIREFERAFAATVDERSRASLHIEIGTSQMSLSRLAEAEGHFREAADALEQHRREEESREKSHEH